jgi:hypothetical protein
MAAEMDSAKRARRVVELGAGEVDRVAPLFKRTARMLAAVPAEAPAEPLGYAVLSLKPSSASEERLRARGSPTGASPSLRRTRRRRGSTSAPASAPTTAI